METRLAPDSGLNLIAECLGNELYDSLEKTSG